MSNSDIIIPKRSCKFKRRKTKKSILCRTKHTNSFDLQHGSQRDRAIQYRERFVIRRDLHKKNLQLNKQLEQEQNQSKLLKQKQQEYANDTLLWKK